MFHYENLDDAPYIVIAYYHFASIEDPNKEVVDLKNFLSTCDVTCRVYVSNEGVNAQMSFLRQDAARYMQWLQSRPLFENVVFKLQGATQHVFSKVIVKNRSLVSFGPGVSLEDRGTHVSPTEWKKMLQEEKEILLLDIRNMYEWEVGHFKGAEPVPYSTFREFHKYAEEVKERLQDEPKKVLMYCTGGIRCEYFSALLKQQGIKDVYQLDGGVINYGEKEGSDEWDGSLFVFDDRLTVPVGEGSKEVIGKCLHCGVKIDRFYNCANMDCNELFLSCEECIEEHVGCCKKECITAPRLRPFQFVHTPFRKWYNYAKTKKDLKNLNALSMDNLNVAQKSKNKEEVLA